jgi:hypothetical protein
VTAPKSPAPAVLNVVGYVQRDPLFGTEFPAVGVVLSVGDTVTVRPLAGQTVDVDPAGVSVLSAADFGGSQPAVDGDGPG